MQTYELEYAERDLCMCVVHVCWTEVWFLLLSKAPRVLAAISVVSKWVASRCYAGVLGRDGAVFEALW